MTREEVQKALSSAEKFSEFIKGISLALEKHMLQDLYQERRKNIDKNIKRVGQEITTQEI